MAAGESSLLPTVMTSLSRPIRIMRGKEVDTKAVVNPGLFEMIEEEALWSACRAASAALSPNMGLREFLEAVAPLAESVDAFFDKVFVMAEDEAIRTNRLALLREVASLQNGVADLSCLPGF